MYVKSIIGKCIQIEIIFTRADKGNTEIAMHKQEYIDKTIDFLSIFQALNANATKLIRMKSKKLLKIVQFSVIGNVNLL